MLETTYILVIDTKNLLDTLDDVRIQQTIETCKTNNNNNKTSRYMDNNAADSNQTDIEESHSELNKSDYLHNNILYKQQQINNNKNNNKNKFTSETSEQIYENEFVQAN